MTKKTKTIKILVECPCEKKIIFPKSFTVVEGTPPEEASFDCLSCDQNIKLKLEHQLDRNQTTYRGIKGE